MRPIQPYQQGLATNQPGMAMANMRRGRTMYGFNPMDQARMSQIPQGSLRWHMMMSQGFNPAQVAQGPSVQGPDPQAQGSLSQYQAALMQHQMAARQAPPQDPAQMLARQRAMAAARAQMGL